jgi:hypothetical protein
LLARLLAWEASLDASWSIHPFPFRFEEQSPMTRITHQKPKVIDRIDADEIYANQIVNFAVDGTAIAVTLGVWRAPPAKLGDTVTPESMIVHVVARIVLSQPAAAELVNFIGRLPAVSQLLPPAVGRAN